MRNLKPHQTAILLAALISAVAWAVPSLRLLLLPVLYLNTHLHELSHALAAVATGGQVNHIAVYAAGNGVTPASGALWAIGPAGYVGASLIGAGVILCSRTPRGARIALCALAAMLALSEILWVRADMVGVVSGACWALALFGLSRLKGMPLLVAAQFIGVQQCLNSIQSVYELLEISASTDLHSDAKLMEAHTYVPAIVWALGWCVISLVLVVGSLRFAWSDSRPIPER